MRMNVALAALATAALALAAAPQAAQAKPAPKRQCFHASSVNGFRAADEHTLYINVGVRDVYQFEMFARCPDMNWNERLALVSRGSSWICSGLDAEVISRTPIGRQRCPVRSIRKLTSQEVAALPKRLRP